MAMVYGVSAVVKVYSQHMVCIYSTCMYNNGVHSCALRSCIVHDAWCTHG